MFKPRSPSKADFEQANYLIKTSGLEAEREERIRKKEAELQAELQKEELERKKRYHFRTIKELDFRPLSKRERELKNAPKIEAENDRRLGIVRAPAVIPSFESLSRDVVKKNYDYTDLPEDDPQRIIIEAVNGGKTRRHKKSKRSRRSRRNSKSRRNKKTKRSRSRR